MSSRADSLTGARADDHALSRWGARVWRSLAWAGVAFVTAGCALFPSFDKLTGAAVPKEAGPEPEPPGEAGTDAPPGVVATPRSKLRCGLSEHYLKAQTPHESALFGASVAAEGDTMVVTAPIERNPWSGGMFNPDPMQICAFRQDIPDPTISGAGVLRAYQRAGANWAEQQIALLSRPGAERSVVDPTLFAVPFQTAVFPAYRLALSGDWLAVGTPGDATRGPFRGSVRVFRRSNGTWSEEPYVVENREGADGDLFGLAVALSDNLLVVGAPAEEVESGDGGVVTDAGAVHVYKLTDAGFVDLVRLTAGFVDESGWYGAAVAVSNNWLAVGSPLEDRGEFGFPHQNPNVDTTDDTGAVYLYAREVDDFQPLKPIIGAEQHGTLGLSLALSGDQLAVGAPNLITHPTVQIFTLGAADAAPEADAVLEPHDPNAYLFGVSVALQAGTVIVGAPFTGGQADGAASGSTDKIYFQSSGTAYIFHKSIGRVWEEEPCHLKASNADPCDNFGTSVAAASDYFAVGSPLEDGVLGGLDRDSASNALFDTGAVYVYTAP